MRKHHWCSNWYLQQLEPESKLVEIYEISENDINQCKKRFSVNNLIETQKEIEDTNGQLDIFSCGAVTGVNDYIKFISKGALVKFGNYSDDLKISEMTNLKEYFKNISTTTANCIINRFEKAPNGKFF